jgi:hypothetical protein
MRHRAAISRVRLASTACVIMAIVNAVWIVRAASADAVATCTIDGGSANFGGTNGVVINGNCVQFNAAGGGAKVVDSKTFDCGRVTRASDVLGRWNPECGSPKPCSMTDPTDPTKQIPTDTYATMQKAADGTWSIVASFWCPSNATPMPDAGAIRDQVIKLLPAVPVGVIHPHLSLVNVQEILWAPTTATKDLGTVTVITTPVRVKLAFEHADWDFGDNTTATTTQPGKIYHPEDPCPTAQCPDYFGHTYTNTGPKTITLTITWTGQYSTNNGQTWTTITGGPLTSPTTTATITLHQARAVLINPDH